MQHLAPQVWQPLLIDKAVCLRWVEEPEVDVHLVPSGPSKDHQCEVIWLARLRIVRTENLVSNRELSEAQFLEASEKN